MLSCFCTATKTNLLALLTSLCVVYSTAVHAQYFSPVPNVLVNAQLTNAGEVNDNFTALITEGNTVFNDFEVQIAAIGAASVPAGMVVPFNLSACPAGWFKSDGTNGTLDLRGRFPRGTTGTPAVGTIQTDQFLDHNQTITHNPNVLVSMSSNTIKPGSENPVGNSNSFTNVVVGNPSTGRFGSESRPKNVALLYCQKS